MTLRKLLAIAPAIGVLALAAPVASSSAQAPAPPSSTVPCYPDPAFCGPNGTPWYQISIFSQPAAPAAAPYGIGCYPYPALCGPNGQPWYQISIPSQLTAPFQSITMPSFGMPQIPLK